MCDRLFGGDRARPLPSQGLSPNGHPRARLPKALTAAAVLMGLAGCKLAIPLIMLAHGFNTIPAQFSKLKGERVVIVCQAGLPIKYNFSAVDFELGNHLARQLREKGIKTVDANEVASWLDEHSDWETAEEIGQVFEAEYVLLVQLHGFTIYEENSPAMFRGRAQASIQVFDMKDPGLSAWEQDHESTYPIGHAVPVDEMRPTTFQRAFLRHLAGEIGRYFYAHAPGEDIKAF